MPEVAKSLAAFAGEREGARRPGSSTCASYSCCPTASVEQLTASRMRTIELDGYGRPTVPDVVSGSVLLLVQGDRVSVVRLELLAPDQFGPCLHPAINEAEITAAARGAVAGARPECLTSQRDWVLECPADIARLARFPI